jgi:hypothetical protein
MPGRERASVTGSSVGALVAAWLPSGWDGGGIDKTPVW